MQTLRSSLIRFAVAVILPGVSATAQSQPTLTDPRSAVALQEPRAWRFKVFLDDKEIGWHTFELSPDAVTLQSKARYDVKFLFISAYTYAHDATEIWDGACLKRMHATTDDNGKMSRVEGRRNGQGFEVVARAGESLLPACVQSFAYWDASILRASHLLNAQTGEYVPVRMLPLGEKQISVRGQAVMAQAWRIQAEAMQIDLWYSNQNEWLALESLTDGGRILRYQIQ